MPLIAAASLLPSEWAALSETAFTSSGITKNGGATLADDYGLSMRENSGNSNAARATNVHEEAVGALYEPLKLVLGLLLSLGRV